MKFIFTQKLERNTPLVFPVFTKKKKLEPSLLPAINQLLKKPHQEGHFEGKEGEIFTRYPDEKDLPSRIIFVCLGDKAKLRPWKILASAAQAIKTLKSQKGTKVSFFIPPELLRFGERLAEALEFGNYDPAKYKTGKNKKKIIEHNIETCEIFIKKAAETQEKQFIKDAGRGRIIADATNNVRDWVNGPPNITSPEFMEKTAKKLAKENGYKLTILRNKEMEKLGMGGILAVNRGSAKEARLLILEYWPGNGFINLFKKKPQPIVLVGKGIVFDSGGYNLKPTGFIEDMHFDMAGAGAVIGLFQLLKKLKISIPVIGLAPITDNMVDAKSVRPSEIIKMFGGKTVEITNTDAEGRLVLGDAIAYASQKYKPRCIIDLATLTGACMVALGDRYAGLFTNSKELKKALLKAGKETDELVWQLPLHPDFEEALKGELTDLRNSDENTARYAGAAKGAAFLKSFYGKTKWAHLDIAGTAYTASPKKYEAKRATGYGVRLLLKFLEGLPKI